MKRLRFITLIGLVALLLLAGLLAAAPTATAQSGVRSTRRRAPKLYPAHQSAAAAAR